MSGQSRTRRVQPIGAMRSTRGGRGFTLIEALAALLVVGIVLPVLIGAIGAASNLGALARDRSEAAALAEARLQELLLTGVWRRGDAAGEFEPPDVRENDARRWRWTLAVEPSQDPLIRAVTLTVQWDRRGQAQSVELTTIADRGEP